MITTPARFPGESRLKKTHEFKKIKDCGRTVSSRLFLMSVGTEPENQQKLGLVVSSIIKRAVDRNRIKRLVREYFRKNKSKFPKSGSVFVAKQRAEKATNKEVFEDLDILLGKTK